VVAAGLAALLPLFAGDPLLLDAARAALLAGPAAAAAIAAAAGRPCLAIAALAAAGGYVYGLATLQHGVAPLLALGLAAVAVTLLGGLLAVVGARVDAAGFLALTFVAAIGGGAIVDAASSTTGGDAGLGPLPGLGLDLSGGRVAELAPGGLLHAALLVAVVTTLLCVGLLRVAPGRRWRAVGGDRERASATGITPLAAEVSALAVAGLVAGLCGALSAALSGVVTPQGFAADAAAVPVAAALLAGRGGPALAALVGVAAGVVEEVVLPRVDYSGPLTPRALVAAVLALAALSPPLLRRLRRVAAARTEAPAAPGGPWPIESPARGRADLLVDGFDVVVAGGPLLVRGLRLRAAAGEIVAIAGANGSGKSTCLRALARSAGRSPHVRLEPASAGRVVLLPQLGGGLPGCSAAETLFLAARAGGHTGGGAAAAASVWLSRLGLESLGGTLCEELPAGARRRLDLARVLLLRPAVVLADEPLAGLDAEERRLTLEALSAAAAAGIAVVLAEHDRAAVAAVATRGVELLRDDVDPRPLRLAGATSA
jgi:branched-chain amino acid transport system permease protein